MKVAVVRRCAKVREKEVNGCAQGARACTLYTKIGAKVQIIQIRRMNKNVKNHERS